MEFAEPVIQERDAYNNPSASYTRGIDLSGSIEGAGGIGGLLARSIYFPQCSTNLTVRITNNTPDTLTGVTIFDSLNAYVMDQTIDPYSFADFAFQGVGGNEYTIFGYGDYYYLPYVGESFTPLLNYYQYEANFDEAHRFSDGMVLCGADSTTMVNYYFCDGNGNITYMMDGAQQMVARYRYDPFGNIIGQDGPLADNNVYRFSSKEFHVASGLYHYGYRFYSPPLQRWVNRDPIEERGGLNLYRYCDNAPTHHIDSLGESNFNAPPATASSPEFIPKCCAGGQPPVTDDAGARCCSGQLEFITLKTDLGGIGHTSIFVGKVGFGFYPADGNKLALSVNMLTGRGGSGHVQPNSPSEYDYEPGYTQVFRACPRTVQRLLASIASHGSMGWSPMPWSQVCTSWACDRLSNAGLTPSTPSIMPRWPLFMPQMTPNPGRQNGEFNIYGPEAGYDAY